jgi:alkylation response protein AidB-like acyl-CoA dehydrogenase
MDLLPTPEELSIAETVAELLRRELPRELLRERTADENTVSDESWLACAESGLLSLGMAEEAGGVGFGAVEETLAFREIGRELAPGPFLASVIGAHLAFAVSEPQLAAAIAEGSTKVGLVSLHATTTLEGGILSGPVDLVDAMGAEYLLVLTPELQAIYARDAFTGAILTESIDPGVRLESATAAAIEPVHRPTPAGDALHARGVLLSAAILTGISEACRDASTLHAKTREQFGRPIGVNQAIKHRCADMAVYSESAGAQLLYAAAALEAKHPDAGYQAAVARIVASRAAISNAEANVQVHGGMGYTWEHDAHLYVKRARVWANLLGSRTRHLAAILGDPKVAA